MSSLGFQIPRERLWSLDKPADSLHPRASVSVNAIRTLEWRQASTGKTVLLVSGLVVGGSCCTGRSRGYRLRQFCLPWILAPVASRLETLATHALPRYMTLLEYAVSRIVHAAIATDGTNRC